MENQAVLISPIFHWPWAEANLHLHGYCNCVPIEPGKSGVGLLIFALEDV